MAPLMITVRGRAQAEYPAERALLRLGVVGRGQDRAVVRGTVAAAADTLTGQLADLQGRGAVTTWSSGQVHTQLEEGLTHLARQGVVAEFVDLGRMSGFVDHWLGREQVEVDGIEWDVLTKNRRLREAEIRKQAVDDAVTTAQGYADAVRRGRVTAVHLADVGMLDDGGGVQPTTRSMTLAASGARGVVLEPAPVVIAVEVDGRFEAP